MSAQKIRGGFYTPAPLVHVCLDRLRSLLPAEGRLKFVEPSAGDGAFLRGIAADHVLAERAEEVLAVEPLEIEAEKCRRSLSATGLSGNVCAESAIAWGVASVERYDAAVGNPPFVRYQFISKRDKDQIASLGKRLGLSFAGVSNLWLPVLLAALSRLRPGGAFGFVVPTELLTGLSASLLRRWLIANCSELRVDLFGPGSFPEVLQEVAVLSGRRLDTSASATLTLAEHHRTGERVWTHRLDPDQPNWTRYLLTPVQLNALDDALAQPAVRSLGELARFQVSIVTGANDFFSVTTQQIEEYDLVPWTRPLLPRIRHAPGLVYEPADWERTVSTGARAWLLDFSESAPNPLRRRGASRYLSLGEDRELHHRYKCRIREPWFRVPGICSGQLLMSKRSHRYPRVIVNRADVYTTDTIYRGDLLPGADLSAAALSAGFHSSLTLLTAELEGRSFGGGVLELVPSEIERLAVVAHRGARRWIERLDRIARQRGEEELVEATDDALVAAGLLDTTVVAALAEARNQLMTRRLARNRREAQGGVQELQQVA